jgi:hypothetical protein
MLIGTDFEQSGGHDEVLPKTESLQPIRVEPAVAVAGYWWARHVWICWMSPARSYLTRGAAFRAAR